MATILPTTTPAAAPVPTVTGFKVVQNSSGGYDRQYVDASGNPMADQDAAAKALYPQGTGTVTNPSPTSTLGALTGVTNSPAGSPASSATGQQNVAGQNAINGVTNPTPAPTDPNVATAAAYQAKGINITADDIKNFGLDQAVTIAQEAKAEKQAAADKAQQLADQQASNLADLAENDAELAAAKAQVDQQMDTLGQQQTNKAADAGYGVSAVGTNQTGAASYVAAQKSYAYTQLENLANQKAAAIRSGNTKAIAAINDAYTKLISDTQSKLATDLASENQNTAARKASDEANAATIANRATSQYNTSLSNLTSASPLNGLFDSNGQPTAGALTNPAFTNSSTYQQGIAAGLTPQAILGDVQNAVKTSKAATAQQKLQDATTAETLKNTILENKIGNLQLEQTASAGYTSNPLGSTYSSAYNSITSYGIKDTVNPATGLTTHGSIGQALATGDVGSAKSMIQGLATQAAKKTDPNGLTLYQGMTNVTNYFPTLQTDIAALPSYAAPGWQNGTLASIEGMLGTNQGKTPADQEAINKVKDDITHITVAYTKMINTRPTAYLTNLIKGVLPNYSDISSLNAGSISSFQGLTTSYGQSVFSDIVGGTSNYNTIFGNGSGSTPTTVQSNGQTYTVGQVYNDGTSNWTVNASGTWTKQ